MVLPRLLHVPCKETTLIKTADSLEYLIVYGVQNLSSFVGFNLEEPKSEFAIVNVPAFWIPDCANYRNAASRISWAPRLSILIAIYFFAKV